MRLNSFIKNSDFNAEKNFLNIYSTTISVPQTTDSRTTTKYLDLPAGDYLTKYYINLKIPNQNVDITTNSSSYQYAVIDGYHILPTDIIPIYGESINVWIAHVSGNRLEITVNSTPSVDPIPPFTVDVRVQLSISPFN